MRCYYGEVNMRYFITFAAALGLLFVVLFLLFHRGGTPKTPIIGRSLGSYSTSDAQAQLTIDGPVNADQIHNSIQITVDGDSVTYEQLQGYQGTVVNSKTFPSNQNAYANFLLALARSGFTKGNNSPALKDERGYCPLGDRYIFRFSQGGTDIERYWATSCGGTATYLGSVGVTLQLFQAQVPNYGDLTENVSL